MNADTLATVVAVVVLVGSFLVFVASLRREVRAYRRDRVAERDAVSLLALDDTRRRVTRLDPLDRARRVGYVAVWVGATAGALLAVRIAAGRRVS